MPASITTKFYSIPELQVMYDVSEYVARRVATRLEIVQIFGRYAFVAAENLYEFEIGLKASGHAIPPLPVDDSDTAQTDTQTDGYVS